MKKEIKKLVLILVVIAAAALIYWGVNSILAQFTAHDLWVFAAGFFTCWLIDFVVTVISGKNNSGKFKNPPTTSAK